MRLYHLVALLSAAGTAQGFTPAFVSHRAAVTRSTTAAMAARRPGDVSRREVMDGNAAYKSFVKAGGGEALLGVIAIAIASFGGSKRNELFEELNALDSSGDKNQGKASHVPTLAITASTAQGKVSVEVSASAGADRIDYVWLKDAETGEILSGRSYAPNEPPVLTTLVERGRRVVALVHCAADGVWESAAVAATASSSRS